MCVIFGFCLFFVGSYFGVLIVLGVGFDLAQIRLQFGFDLGSSLGSGCVLCGSPLVSMWVLIGFYWCFMIGFYLASM